MTRTEIPGAGFPPVDRDGNGGAQAPEGTSGSAPGERGYEPANVCAGPNVSEKVYCLGCAASVPGWFARDCIEGDCPLRACGRCCA